MDSRRKIAIDLTPLTRNSRIGGAKALALELVRNFSSINSRFDYVLLTCEDSHEELAWLEAENIRRVCVKASPGETTASRARQRLHLLVNAWLPEKMGGWLKSIYRGQQSGKGSRSQLQELGVDLLLCPFTGPLYHTPGIPTVAVVHDLQFLVYPEYFSKLDLMYLREHFIEACDLSTHLISGSKYAKKTIIGNSDLKAEDITVIYDSAHSRLDPKVVPAAGMLAQWGLAEDQYLIFPARLWPHKNHLKALQAFKQALAQIDAELKLVFSGLGAENLAQVERMVGELGLSDRVVLFDWVTDDQLAGLYQSCLALFFPSQYEGFGIPIIEAFQFGKPVLCSNVTSLPEVAGEAALYFNPVDVDEMAAVIVKAVGDPDLRAELARKGKAQLAKFPDGRGMAEQYEGVFREVLHGR